MDEEAERGGGRVRGKEAEERVGVLKAELAALLRKPILPCSVSMTFPTRDKNHKILAGVQSEKGGQRCRLVLVCTYCVYMYNIIHVLPFFPRVR